jgi:hypothetical protein
MSAPGALSFTQAHIAGCVYIARLTGLPRAIGTVPRFALPERMVRGVGTPVEARRRGFAPTAGAGCKAIACV